MKYTGSKLRKTDNMKRCSGIILPLYSLPSKYGIGTLGKAAFDFADFLAAAGQRLWQMLPLGPTGYGDSPYQSLCDSAGNPYFIDLELIKEDGLLTDEELAACDFGGEPRYVDYGKLFEGRMELLKKAKLRGWDKDAEEVTAFRLGNASWLEDYALFMACKKHFDYLPWTQWPDRELRLGKDGKTLKLWAAELKADVELFIYVQFLFFKQWNNLRAYLRSLDISVAGDLPIYPALDSAEVWANRRFFLMDEEGRPSAVSGVPPDDFTKDGQLWGSPLYNWETLKEDGYGFWIRRIGEAEKRFDYIRIDHFRGLYRYWAVPAGAESAAEGEWRFGPGMDFIGRMNDWFGSSRFLAEDLGAPDEGVGRLLKESGWPGMKVLEFAFKPGEDSPYLPHNHIENCLCCTGTHDNPPLAQWIEEADEKTKEKAVFYTGISSEQDLAAALIRAGMSSVAKVFIAQMQDYLGLGKTHRTNKPGTSEGNWRWRMLPGEASPELAKALKEISELYGRSRSDSEQGV